MTLRGVYLFVGPDRDRKRERIKAIAQGLDIQPLDRHDVSAPGLSASTLLALAREHPAASPVRLIVIDEAHRLGGACLKALEEQAEILKQTAYVILLVDVALDANHPLSSLGKHATIERFSWPAPQETGQWIRRYVAIHKKQIMDSAIHDLLQVYGADRAGIRAILDQLLSWVGSRPQLTQADLRVFLQVPTTKSGFALVDAIANRDVGTALLAIQEQLAEGKEILELLGLLTWQLQRWLTVGHLLEAGTVRERIATLTGLRPWQLERMVAELAGRSTASLRRALQACWQLDLAAKSGRVPIPRVGLEQVVVELCLGLAAA